MARKKPKKKPAVLTKAPAPTGVLTADDMIKIMNHAKALNIGIFKGPGGLEFVFKRQAVEPETVKPKVEPDSFIP